MRVYSLFFLVVLIYFVFFFIVLFKFVVFGAGFETRLALCCGVRVGDVTLASTE